MNRRRYLFAVLILLLMAGSLAITQESSDSAEEAEGGGLPADDDGAILLLENTDEPEAYVEPLPEWVTPARWYRSNSGGMMLEEIQSRLVAMRNEYALVSDFISRDELPKILLPYYNNRYIDHYIEIRALFKNGTELRRQWIFRDANGLYRLVAVFMETKDGNDENDAPETDEAAVGDIFAGDVPPSEDDFGGGDSDAGANTEIIADNAAAAAGAAVGVAGAGAEAANGSPGSDAEKIADNAVDEEGNETDTDEESFSDYRIVQYRNLSGFIEIYGGNFLLEREIVFSGEDDVREIRYVYNRGTLISAVSMQSNRVNAAGNAQKIYTDNYRYNRSGSLRSVERTYHERLEAENVILRFAHRVLDAAASSMFQSDQVLLSSNFFEEYSVEPEQKMVFTTDERNRILTQSLLDSEGETIWVIRNTWSGDRIVSALKTEGDDKKLNEYEYNANGGLVMERNLHNGVLQRRVRIDGNREIEELYMNGLVVLRAVWEDGRKVSEQRVRPEPDSRSAPEQPLAEQQMSEQQVTENVSGTLEQGEPEEGE